MAQKTITLLVSDLSGKELGEDGQTVRFGFLGVDYEMDVSQKEADEFAKAMEKYVSVARRTGGRRQSGVGAGAGRTTMDKEQAKKIRQWAAANGYKVSSRGRIPEEVQEAFQKAHAA